MQSWLRRAPLVRARRRSLRGAEGGHVRIQAARRGACCVGHLQS